MTAPALPAGVLVALVTPVAESGGLDRPALGRLVERVVAGGVRGVCPAGSTGEGPRLTRRERVAVAGAVRALLPDDLPMVPGVVADTAAEALEELEELAEAGATAALLAPPTYYPMADDEVERLYRQLADASPLPLLLYNIPGMTGVRIAADVVARLAGHPRVAGIKDSSRDLEYLQDVLTATSGEDAFRIPGPPSGATTDTTRTASAGSGDSPFRVYTGTDTLLMASLAAGVDGTIAASANLVPELGVGLHSAVVDGDLVTARRLQSALGEIVRACRRGPFPAGWKAALEIAGVCSRRLVPPGTALPLPAVSELADDLERCDVAPPLRGA